MKNVAASVRARLANLGQAEGIGLEFMIERFANRQTELPSKAPFALTEAFFSDKGKQTQWNAFLRKNRLEIRSLDQVIGHIREFLLPVILDGPSQTTKTWHPGIGWHESSS